MKINKSILSLIIIISIVSLTLIYLLTRKNYSLIGCEKYSGTQAATCLIEAAIQNSQPQICKKISQIKELKNKDFFQNQCLTKLALIINNADICKENTDKNFISSCIFEIAKKNQDEALCNQLVDKNFCLKDVAELKKDPKICEKIDQEILKSECEADSSSICLPKKYYNTNNKGYFDCNNKEIQNTCTQEPNCSWGESKSPGRKNQCVCCPMNSTILPDRCIVLGD